MPAPAAAGPVVETAGVTFRYLDPDEAIASVSVVQEVTNPRNGPALERRRGGLWAAELERPPVDRLEYRLEVERLDGARDTLLDPANPLRAPGAFGERSVIEFPEYRPPKWLPSDPPAGAVQEIRIPSALLGEEQPTLVWSAAGTSPRDPLPLLIALDGEEFARFSGLLHLLDAEVASGGLPPMRAALCQPTRRDEHYTASPDFAEYLARQLIPAVEDLGALAPGPRFRVGLGASLGGLALLHAHRRFPRSLGALFLQSSSFFQPGSLPGSANIERIERFVGDVTSAPSWDDPIRVVMTCGTVEQNLENNRDCVAALVAQGYPAVLRVVRDAHNWIAWRDAWTPHLVDLLVEAWS